MNFLALPVLSTGQGANEDPLSDGGLWANASPSFGGLQRINNSISGNDDALPNFSYCTQLHGPDCYAFLTVEIPPTLDGERIELLLQTTVVPGDVWNSYYVRLNRTAGTFDQYLYQRRDAGVATVLAGPITGPALVAGDGLGLQRVGSSLVIWTRQSNRWLPLDGGVTDTTYLQPGYPGLRIDRESQAAHITNFGAGTLTTWLQRAR